MGSRRSVVDIIAVSDFRLPSHLSQDFYCKHVYPTPLQRQRLSFVLGAGSANKGDPDFSSDEGEPKELTTASEAANAIQDYLHHSVHKRRRSKIARL